MFSYFLIPYKPMHNSTQNSKTQKYSNFSSIFESSQVRVWRPILKLDSTMLENFELFQVIYFRVELCICLIHNPQKNYQTQQNPDIHNPDKLFVRRSVETYFMLWCSPFLLSDTTIFCFNTCFMSDHQFFAVHLSSDISWVR